MTQSNYSVSSILKLALPIILGGIAQNVILATDVFFMARVDEISLDAVGLAGLFFSTVYILGLGFSTGVQILIARRHGEKANHSIGNIFDNSLIFLFCTSLVLWVAMEYLGPPVLKTLIQSEAVYEKAILFLDQRTWGITFAMINLAFRAFYIGTSKPGIIIWSTLIMALTNIFLNDALIFGKYGFPALGIEGSAIASSLSEISAMIIFIGYTFIGKFNRAFNLFGSWKLNVPVMKHIVKIASPVMFQYFVSHAGWFLFFIVIEQSGERALAISVVIRMIYMFQMVPFWGFMSATNTMVSFAIGEGRSAEVMSILRKITGMSIVAALPFMALNFIIPEWVIGLAVEDKTGGIISDSVQTLHVITIALFFFAIAMTWFSGVSGSGNTRTALWIETTTIAMYLIVAWFLGIFLKEAVHIIWITEPIYFMMLGMISYIYMRSGKWKGKMI